MFSLNVRAHMVAETFLKTSYFTHTVQFNLFSNVISLDSMLQSCWLWTKRTEAIITVTFPLSKMLFSFSVVSGQLKRPSSENKCYYLRSSNVWKHWLTASLWFMRLRIYNREHSHTKNNFLIWIRKEKKKDQIKYSKVSWNKTVIHQ